MILQIATSPERVIQRSWLRGPGVRIIRRPRRWMAYKQPTRRLAQGPLARQPSYGLSGTKVREGQRGSRDDRIHAGVSCSADAHGASARRHSSPPLQPADWARLRELDSWKTRHAWPASSGRQRQIPCGIHSQPILWMRATTSAPFSNCSAIAMSARRWSTRVLSQGVSGVRSPLDQLSPPSRRWDKYAPMLGLSEVVIEISLSL